MLTANTGLNKLSRSSVVLCVRRLMHRQRLSKMFPAVDLHEARSRSDSKDSRQPDTELAACISQKLMTQQRLIQVASSGTFYLLPGVTRALEKLYRLIDQEMYSIGAQKITMPCLAPKQLWNASGRWEMMGSELFKLVDRNKSEHCLAPTHEEAVTSIIAAESPISYKRLPVKLYQIGRKFRDEARPKHGLLRCREFEMKDLYTFDANLAGAEKSYNDVCEAYARLLGRLRLPHVTVEASSGAMGGTKSQEFHVLSPVGEDVLHCCPKCNRGVNQELLDERSDQKQNSCTTPDCSGILERKSGIEVAHAFILGTKYSEALKATFVDQSQIKKPLYMACFGIGVTRLLATAVDSLSAADQIRWPSLLAPYQICIIPQKEGYKSEVTNVMAESLYDVLTKSCSGLRSEVVIDDRLNMSIGHRVRLAKFSGYQHIVALGKEALLETPLLEHIDVNQNTKQHVTQSQLLDILTKIETVNIM